MKKISILLLYFQDGRTHDKQTIAAALEHLSRNTYPLEQLKDRPLPEGVDARRLERYLGEEDFGAALGMSRAEFKELPIWKQTKLKKGAGLY